MITDKVAKKKKVKKISDRGIETILDNMELARQGKERYKEKFISKVDYNPDDEPEWPYKG